VTIQLKQFTKVPNAGDAASGYVVSRILGTLTEAIGDAPITTPNLIAIGSILHWVDEHSIVWGTGLISHNISLRRPPSRILAVRGYATRKRLSELGIDTPSLVGDPGILISDIYPSNPRSTNRIGIIPHYMDVDHPFVIDSIDRGAVFIDPRISLEDYLCKLSSCEVIISSSLHGVIFSHSYGIPSVWVKLSDKVIGDGYKFYDYYSSIGLESNDIPTLTGNDSFQTAIDHASLPKREIDRGALSATLRSAASQLLDWN
jgi:pyruvyltransferase